MISVLGASLIEAQQDDMSPLIIKLISSSRPNTLLFSLGETQASRGHGASHGAMEPWQPCTLTLRSVASSKP